MSYNFNNIAGYETEKQELARLCEIFSNRDKYLKKGAKLPKGVIFYGDPGNGKTLFSKVMADVCDLEVFKIDLGDVENESAICRHIKKTFVKASKSKGPSMVFFDEVDKVLPNPDEDYFTDRSKTILTQLLTLIDGMDSASNVIFVATCNHYNSLPETFTRPGRMDKKIFIPYPDFKSRTEIIKYYVGKTSCKFQMDYATIAELASDMSASALETLINECVLQSDENGFVSEDLLKAVLFEIKNEDIPRETSTIDDTITACGNVASYLVASTYSSTFGSLILEEDHISNALFTQVVEKAEGSYDDDDDDYYDDDDDDDDDYYDDGDEDDCNENGDDMFTTHRSKSDYINTITVLLAPYIAQELLYNKVFDDVNYYLSSIDEVVLDMFRYGMFGIENHFTCDRHESLPYSDSQIAQFNAIQVELVNSCYNKAKEILVKNQELLKAIIPVLVQKRLIKADEMEAMITSLGGLVQ